MKRILSILLCAIAIPASAQSYDYLTFQKTNGAEKSLTSTRLKIVFRDNQMVVSNASGETFSSPLSEMKQMYFSAEATGIFSTQTSQEGSLKASILNGRLTTNAPAGSTISVMSLDGRMLNADAPLGKGTYIVRINDTTLKVVAL